MFSKLRRIRDINSIDTNSILLYITFYVYNFTETEPTKIYANRKKIKQIVINRPNPRRKGKTFLKERGLKSHRKE